MPKSKQSSDHRLVSQAVALANDMTIEHVKIIDVHMPSVLIKKYSARAIAGCRAILHEFGQLMPLLVSPDNVIISGQEMYLAASEAGVSHVRIVRAHGIDDNARRALTIGFAKLPELSPWDLEVMKGELDILHKIDLSFDLDAIIMLNTAEQDVLLNPGSLKQATDAADECPALPEPSEVVTRPGDVWKLGDHRVACSDALRPSTYALLLGDRGAQLLLTDPPFNVGIAGNVSGLGKNKHGDFAMGIGEFTQDQFTNFLKTFLSNSSSHLREGALAFSFMDRRHLVELSTAATAAGYTVLDLAFWNKLSGGMGGLYRSQHEPCFVFKWGKAPHINNVQLGKFGRYRTNVWDHPGLSRFGKGRDEALRDHPTVKPVALLAEIIKDVTRRGDVVLDPFAGSGSTIMAAEKTGRVGYGIELEPKYVDVIVRRWETFTGKQATHAETGQTFAEMREERPSEAAVADDAVSLAANPPVKLRQRPTPVRKEVHHA